MNSQEDRQLLAAISKLGVATELELQSITFMDLDDLKEHIGDLESKGLIKREYGFLSASTQGDGLKITNKGVKMLS